MLCVHRENFLEGSVSVEGQDKFILLQGHASLNRAVDGDIVAIELLPGVVTLNRLLVHNVFTIYRVLCRGQMDIAQWYCSRGSRGSRSR